jgi:diacylglycerol kinase
MASAVAPSTADISTYLAANPSILADYVTANPALITDFLTKSTATLTEYIRANPDIIKNLLDQATTGIPNPFPNILYTVKGFAITLEMAIFIAVPIVFCAALLFVKNIFSQAMLVNWLLIGILTGAAYYGIHAVPKPYQPLARIVGDYMGAAAIFFYSVLSILVIVIGLFMNAATGAISAVTHHAI